MPLFKVSVESQIPVSAVVISNAPTEALALAEVRLLQSRARVNWKRGLVALGAIEAPYEIWAQKNVGGSFTVSLYALIPIFSLSSTIAEDSETVQRAVQDLQASGLIPWTYRGVPVGDYREPIPTFWSNQQPDIVTFTESFLSTNALYPGQGVTLSADISGEETPAGNLEFRDQLTGALIIPTTLEPDAITNGIAHAQAVVVLPSGVYSIYATFLGSDGYQPSSSTPNTLTIAKLGTDVVITPPTPPIYAGQSVSLNVTVINGEPNLPAPTGILTLFEGATVTGSTQLVSSSGTFSLGALPPGTYSFTVQYEGDGTHDGSSNSVSGITVLQVPTSMGISVLDAFGFPISAAVFSQTVRIYTTVTSGVDGTIPTGTVTFKEGVTVLGVGAVSPVSESTNTASAYIDIANFSVGTHSSLTAAYGGNASFAASVSGSTFVVVSKASVFINAYSVNSPTTFGQTAVFDATVSAQPPATLAPFQLYGVAGSVTYVVQGSGGGPVVVNFDGTGHAVRSVGGLSPGAKVVDVTFSATAEYNSGFVSFPHVVTKANTTTNIFQFTPNPAAWYYNTSIACTVIPVAPGSGTVTGTVSFSVYDQVYWGNLFLGTGTMMGGTAGISFNWFILASDNYLYTALYNGDSNFNSSQDQKTYFGYGYFF